nr:hypothetical protein [Tanacetum cinerariifolium]
VSILLLSAKTGLREFDQQRDNGLQSGNNVDKDTKPNTARSSSSELKMLDDLEMNKLLPTSLLWSDHKLVEDHEKWHMGIYIILKFIAGLFSFYMEFSTVGHVSIYARISEMFVRSAMLKVYVEIAKSSQCIIVLLTCGFLACNLICCTSELNGFSKGVWNRFSTISRLEILSDNWKFYQII